MDMKLELVSVPVTDVDRAKAFYVDQVGFDPDHDYQVTDELRFVQLTPPGSGCSIVIGTGITNMAPGFQDSLYASLVGAGYQGHRKPWDAVWGQRHATLHDPDGNGVDLFAPLASA